MSQIPSDDDIPTTEEELYYWFQWYEETHPKDPEYDLDPKRANNNIPTNPHKFIRIDQLFQDELEDGR